MPPMRGVGARIDREEQALVAQMLVELLAGDARLDHAVEILGMDRDDAVHPAGVDRDAAERRVDMALERGAGAERRSTGTPCAAQSVTISATSSVVSG